MLPALTDRPIPNDQEWALFAIPVWHGGLEIRIPSKNAERELQSSLLVTSPLVSRILEQSQEYGYEVIVDQLQSRATIRNKNKGIYSASHVPRFLVGGKVKSLASTIHAHEVNSHQINYPRDQLPRGQLPPDKLPTRSTSHKINSREVNSHQIDVIWWEKCDSV